MDYLISSAQQPLEVQRNELVTDLVNRYHLWITVLSPFLERFLDLSVLPFNFLKLSNYCTKLRFYMAVITTC